MGCEVFGVGLCFSLCFYRFPVIVPSLGYKVYLHSSGLQSNQQAGLVTSEVRHGYVVQIMPIRKEKGNFTNYLS